MTREPHPSDVSGEEWALVAPYPALLPETSAQRRHDLREVFDGPRHVAKTGAPWRRMPDDLPPREIVHRQAQRRLPAGVLGALAHDPRVLLLRLGAGRKPEPSAVVLDSRTLRSTPGSGHRAGWDGAKREEGSKVHAAADTLGHLLAPHVTPATAGDRAQAGETAEAAQEVTGQTVETASVDQGYAGAATEAAAAEHGIRPEAAKHHQVERGFVPPPGRWVVERSFARAARFRRLVRDYERLPGTLRGPHVVAFARPMLKHAALASRP